MDIEQKTKQILLLIEEEEVMKSKRNFLGLIGNYDEQIKLDNSLGCYILFYCKAYCYIRLGKTQEANETLNDEMLKRCATILGRDTIRYATACLSIFMFVDIKELQPFHINTIINLLENPDSSHQLKRIVFDYKDLIGDGKRL